MVTFYHKYEVPHGTLEALQKIDRIGYEIHCFSIPFVRFDTLASFAEKNSVGGWEVWKISVRKIVKKCGTFKVHTENAFRRVSDPEFEK